MADLDDGRGRDGCHCETMCGTFPLGKGIVVPAKPEGITVPCHAAASRFPPVRRNI